jgi:phospholipid/cholesterol/gamma-HCH transport system substrate-binding protein
VVVVLLAVAAPVLGGCALSLQSLPKISSYGSGTYPVHADFADVLNLPDDAQVRMGAQVVGQVAAIATRDYRADLTLDIEHGVGLPVGTTAQVRFDDPLGDEYVELRAPAVVAGAPAGKVTFLRPGAGIPETATSTAPSVEDTFGALSLVLNGGGINQLETIIRELNDTFGGNQPQIRSLLGTIDRGVGSLAGGRAAIDAALTSIARLTSELDGGRSTIADGISTIAPAVGVLAQENTQISGLLTQLSNLGQVGTQIAQQSGEASVADVHDLLPVAQQLESIAAQLTPDLADLSAFEAAAPKVAPGDYLQVSDIVNVILPPGGYEATALSANGPGAATGAPLTAARGGRAVSDLLAASVS